MVACEGNFPNEIYMGILVRLPVKSLIRFKVVCKSWKSTISSAYFIDRHSDGSATNPSKLAIVLDEYSEFESKCSIFFHTLDFSATCSGEIIIMEHPIKNCKAADPLSWCRGFLLLRVECNTTKMLLWNPSTRECKEVPNPPIPYYHYKSIFASALGYDFTIKTNKIVLICETPRGRHSNIFCVYNVKKNTWTSVIEDDENHKYQAYYERAPTTLVNGAPHWWVSYDGVSHDDDCYFEIEYFDFSKNQFGVIPQPDDHDNDYRAVETTELSNMEGFLCMGCFLLDNVTLWAMEVYGVKESWSKMMIFNDIVSPICFAKTDNNVSLVQSLVRKYIVQERKDRYDIYNGTERGIELKLLAGRDVTRKSAFAFSESLISLETELMVEEELQEPKIEFGKLIIGHSVWW
ncbi:hypothetical protein CCACVL1_28472 [Corchorus capsularis]|uniref:F-box domain-containing protein n=1 Tax=Corchorus capsularis TaxID=210143 RepID=A0A1R3G6E7_COCAP|nr:hypothetical protein CCACVL1_28472 [Corchorus capsularis]